MTSKRDRKAAGLSRRKKIALAMAGVSLAGIGVSGYVAGKRADPRAKEYTYEHMFRI